MPVHDWTRVSTGTFHDFHSAWIIHLKETLNGGLLPDGYYAMAEQQAGQLIADVLIWEVSDRVPASGRGRGGVALAEAPPRVSRKMVAGPNAAYRASRRTLAIRHSSNHRIVALLEIISPANKDRALSVKDFVEKVHSALRYDIHLLIVDLFPPGSCDPHGIHGAIWEDFDPADYIPPADKPLTLVAYMAAKVPEACLEPMAVGNVMPEMPLFLDRDFYINVPLESTYALAYCGLPAYWRGVVEGQHRAAPD